MRIAPLAPRAPDAPRAPFVPAAIYLLLATAWSWPLPLHLANRFAHDPGDPLLVTYLLWWNAHVVPLTDAMWNAPFYWPLRDALALTEHGAGMAVVTSPIQWLGGSPLLAYNVLLIVSVWWAGLAMHALARRLASTETAAYCAGCAFAFAPYRASQLAHLQLLVTWWLPLALLGLHAYYEDGRRRWLLLFGVAWLMQSLTSGYYMFFLPVLLVVWIAWFTPWRTAARKAFAVAVTWLLFSLPLVPVLLKYQEVQHRLGLGRTRGEMQLFAARFSSFLNSGPLLRFWRGREGLTQEDFLFPGAAAAAIIVAALPLARRTLAAEKRLTFIFYLAAALLMTWMTFGPAAEQRSLATLWHAYGWISWLPGFSGLRVPERFFMLATLCLAAAAGMAMSVLARTFPRRARAIATVACLALLADGWIVAMPLGAPPGPFGVDIGNDGRVLELPTTDDNVNVGAIYRSMLHHLPVINGYAGYVPPHAGVIEWALRRKDPSVLTELRRGHPLYVAIANGLEAPEWTAFMDAQNDALMIGVSAGGRLYRMPPAAYPRQIAVGAALPASSVRLETGWLVLDLGRAATVRAIDLRTRGHLPLLPRTVRVETSNDGSTWAIAADEPPGGLALIGALAEPRVVPLRIFMPDVEARFARINAAAFGTGAVTVYGP